MDTPEQSVCSNCGGDDAAFFLVTIVLGEKESRSLCKKCYEQSQSGSPIYQAMQQGKCRFCGGRAAAVDAMVQIVNGPEADLAFLCLSCSIESNTVVMEKFQAVEGELESLPYLEQKKRLSEVMEQIDTHMRRWVIQRDN